MFPRFRAPFSEHGEMPILKIDRVELGQPLLGLNSNFIINQRTESKREASHTHTIRAKPGSSLINISLEKLSLKNTHFLHFFISLPHVFHPSRSNGQPLVS